MFCWSEHKDIKHIPSAVFSTSKHIYRKESSGSSLSLTEINRTVTANNLSIVVDWS